MEDRLSIKLTHRKTMPMANYRSEVCHGASLLSRAGAILSQTEGAAARSSGSITNTVSHANVVVNEFKD